MNLYIIGNGFDLVHDIQSSYSDFRIYVQSRDAMLHFLIEYYYSNKNLWNDFEKTLGKIDPAHIYKLEEKENLNYDDLDEKDLHRLSDSLAYNCKHISQKMKNSFTSWVQQINILSAGRIMNIKKNSIFLSFNYTETLEDIYGINPTKILHIHGDRTNPIFGHTEPEMTSSICSEEQWIGTDDAEDAAQGLFQKTIKPVKQIIEQNKLFFNNLINIKHVYILGHSLNDTDMPYFRRIVPSTEPNTSWHVSYYTSKDKSELYDKLAKLGVKKIDLFNFKEILY